MKKINDPLLDKALEDEEKRIEFLIFKVCLSYKITTEDLASSSRFASIVEPRNIIFYVLHKVYKVPCEKVAEMFGRTHATVLSGAKRISGFIETDKVYEKKISDIINNN